MPKTKLNNTTDLQARILALELENQLYLKSIKTDLTKVSTYLPDTISEGMSMNSITGVMHQLDSKGFKLGLLLPIVLNNTFFRSKSEATKTFITSLSLILDDNVSFKEIKKNVKKLFKPKKKKKKKKSKKKLVAAVISEKPIEALHYNQTNPK